MPRKVIVRKTSRPSPNPAGRPVKYREEMVEAALREGGGVPQRAARILRCDHHTVTEAMARWPRLKVLADELREQSDYLDFAAAESVVRAQLRQARDKMFDSDNRPRSKPGKLTRSEQWATQFILTRSRAGRAKYADRTELTGRDGSPVAHLHAHLHVTADQVRGMSDEQLERLYDGDTRALPPVDDAGGGGAGAAAPGPRRPTAH